MPGDAPQTVQYPQPPSVLDVLRQVGANVGNAPVFEQPTSTPFNPALYQPQAPVPETLAQKVADYAQSVEYAQYYQHLQKQQEDLLAQQQAVAMAQKTHDDLAAQNGKIVAQMQADGVPPRVIAGVLYAMAGNNDWAQQNLTPEELTQYQAAVGKYALNAPTDAQLGVTDTASPQTQPPATNAAGTPVSATPDPAAIAKADAISTLYGGTPSDVARTGAVQKTAGTPGSGDSGAVIQDGSAISAGSSQGKPPASSKTPTASFTEAGAPVPISTTGTFNPNDSSTFDSTHYVTDGKVVSPEAARALSADYGKVTPPGDGAPQNTSLSDEETQGFELGGVHYYWDPEKGEMVTTKPALPKDMVNGVPVPKDVGGGDATQMLPPVGGGVATALPPIPDYWKTGVTPPRQPSFSSFQGLTDYSRGAHGNYAITQRNQQLAGAPSVRNNGSLFGNYLVNRLTPR